VAGRIEALDIMKLLIVGPDLQDLQRVKNFTGVQAYYLCREFRARDIELVFAKGKHPQMLEYLAGLDGQGADHVLALGLRWFTHQPLGAATILKTKVSGAVTQLHDGLVHEYLMAHLENVDCTFTFRDDSIRTKQWDRYEKTNHYIGWAADPDLLYPEQSAEQLRILIDHPYYKNGTPDITEAVTKDVVAFMLTGGWRDKWKSIKVRRLVNGGAEDVHANDPMHKQFDRQHVPFPDIAREYRKSHVYMVTHKESVGLTCLEMAFCGALTVASRGMIYQDRLDTIRHVTYDGVRAPWGQVLDMIHIKQSAEMARVQSWDKVADRMLGWFGSYK
jgi:hypothetical protein